jgi:hypothetical protein
MNATQVTPYFFATEALVCEVIAFEMSPSGVSVVAGSGFACVGAFETLLDFLLDPFLEDGEGGQTTGSFLQTQHAVRP